MVKLRKVSYFDLLTPTLTHRSSFFYSCGQIPDICEVKVVETLPNWEYSTEAFLDFDDATTSDELYFCHDCGASYRSKIHLSCHIITEHSRINRVKKETQIELTEHTKLSSIEENIEGDCQNFNKIIDEGYKCDICSKVIKSKAHLKSHSTIHTGEKPFCCHICGAKFRLKINLNAHLNQKHKLGEKFSCELCQKVFFSRQNLHVHMYVHSDGLSCVCETCGKVFKNDSCLRMHRRSHSNHFPHECGICGKKFRIPCLLKEHMMIHSGVKKYQCELCGSAFRRAWDRTKHMKRHTSSRLGECSCEICGKKFSQSRYLSCHMRKHENDK